MKQVHTIELAFTCEELERIVQAAKFTGYGTELERYLKSIITEHV